MTKGVGNGRLRQIVTIFVAVTFVGVIAGCESVKESIGYTKSAPDEFAVYKRAPLTLPPDYQLKPPQPGAPRPQEGSTKRQAQSALFGTRSSSSAGGLSQGESAFLKNASALDVDPSIRRTINQETSIFAEESVSFTERLMFWDDTNPYGSVVDPTKESKRINENLALGKPVNTGEVPTISRKPKALLEGLFD